MRSRRSRIVDLDRSPNDPGQDPIGYADRPQHSPDARCDQLRPGHFPTSANGGPDGYHTWSSPRPDRPQRHDHHDITSTRRRRLGAGVRPEPDDHRHELMESSRSPCTISPLRRHHRDPAVGVVEARDRRRCWPNHHSDALHRDVHEHPVTGQVFLYAAQITAQDLVVALRARIRPFDDLDQLDVRRQPWASCTPGRRCARVLPISSGASRRSTTSRSAAPRSKSVPVVPPPSSASQLPFAVGPIQPGPPPVPRQHLVEHWVPGRPTRRSLGTAAVRLPRGRRSGFPWISTRVRARGAQRSTRLAYEISSVGSRSKGK